MSLLNFIGLRFRQTDTSVLDGDNDPIEVTLLDGLPVNVVKGATGVAQHMLTGQLTTVAGKNVVAGTRPERTRMILKNTDAAITVYYGGTSVSTTTGMPLLPGESVTLYVTDTVYVIPNSGTPVVAWYEEFN